MDEIKFRLEREVLRNFEYTCVAIYINGESLLEMVKGVNCDGELIDEHSFLGVEDICNILLYKDHDEWYSDGRITVMGCICGDRDCGPFKVRLVETEDSIIWEDFNPLRKLADYLPSSFEFDKNQYNKETEYLAVLLKTEGVIKLNSPLRFPDLQLKQRQSN